MLCKERPKNPAPGYLGMLPILGSSKEVSVPAQQVQENQQPVLLMPCSTSLLSFSLSLHTCSGLRGLGLFSLKNRRLWGDFIVVIQGHLKGIYKKDGVRLFNRACCNRTRVMVLN